MGEGGAQIIGGIIPFFFTALPSFPLDSISQGRKEKKKKQQRIQFLQFNFAALILAEFVISVDCNTIF